MLKTGKPLLPHESRPPLWARFGLRRSRGWFVAGMCLKCFGGPGEIRTHDLFHAMEVRSTTYRQSHQKQKTYETEIWTPRGRHARFHRFLDSDRTPGFTPGVTSRTPGTVRCGTPRASRAVVRALECRLLRPGRRQAFPYMQFRHDDPTFRSRAM